MTDLTEDDLPDHNQDLRDALDKFKRKKKRKKYGDDLTDEELDALAEEDDGEDD
jgi:hypothetical protein